jgi:DNA-directed RNA polymerase specialized sigma24 family protein
MDKAENLTILARLGDEEDFRLIFDKYHCIALRFIYVKVGNLAPATELTQETF